MKRRSYDKTFYRKLWGLMVPIVLQNLMLALVAVADAFMLGGMDQNYMSAVSLATQIQFIQKAISKRWMKFSAWLCACAGWYQWYFLRPACSPENI